MRLSAKCLTVALCAGLLAGQASAFSYLHDDGFADYVVVLGSAGQVMWWANGFTAQPGAELITSIQVAFGHTSVGGAAFVVALYEDTDDDGDPNTGLSLLTHASATVQYPGTNTFQTVDIDDQIVSGAFFVATAMAYSSGLMPGSFDDDSPAGQSWAAVLSDMSGLSGPITAHNMDSLMSAIGISPGTWMLRANGEAIPEPLTLAGTLSGLGMAGVALRRRLRRA